MSQGYVEPHLDYLALLPIIIVFAGGLVGVLVEAFVPRAARHVSQLVLTLVTFIGAFVAIFMVARDRETVTGAGTYVNDQVAMLVQCIVLVLAFIGTLAMAERFNGQAMDAFTQSGVSTPGSAYEAQMTRAGATSTEVFPLVTFSVMGMMLFPAAGDLMTLFIALELTSLPLYILAGLARRRRLLSQEASLKYFLLGAFSSAFYLFGAVLLFGFAGTMNLAGIADAVTSGSSVSGTAAPEALLAPGVLLVLVGLLFKVGAVPFHMWTPDVYQGAPTPVTGFMAALVKVAAFGAILRVLYVGFEGAEWNWYPIVFGIAILTMVVGAVLTAVQTDVKRLLAYSSVAHAGFILVGILAMNEEGIGATLFYVTTYGFMTIAAFALIALVRSAGSEATHLSQWAGLGRRAPVVAFTFTFLMMAFTGLPLTSGFTAKFAVFGASLADGQWVLPLVGVLCSAITAFAYFRVVVAMFFSEPAGDTRAIAPSLSTAIAVTAGVAVTLVLGILPGPLLGVVSDAAMFIR